MIACWVHLCLLCLRRLLLLVLVLVRLWVVVWWSRLVLVLVLVLQGCLVLTLMVWAAVQLGRLRLWRRR